MRLSTDLQPFQATATPVWSKVTGQMVGAGFVPDTWTNIPFTVGGDGIQPVPGKSFLSWQPAGGWQARATCGPWETPIVQGNFLIYCANGTGTIIVVPFVQIA
jgi:hypothetical protein